MGMRREARERAVQFLFQHDVNPPEDLEAALNQFWDSQRPEAIAEDKGDAKWGQPTPLSPPTPEELTLRFFAEALIRGALAHRDDIPPVVSINEAVDIAKKFSTEESGRFVNGILDKVKGELLRPARTVQ